MTLTELRYIVAVARERHFGRAAQTCFVSQPTLSVAIRKLENELNVVLFERSKNDVRVTRIGESIIHQAQQVLDQAAQIKHMAKSGGDQLKGILKVGSIFTVGPYLFPHLVPRIRNLAPEMPLLIKEGFTADLRRDLLRGDLDAIIVALPFDEPGVTVTPLYDEPFVVLLPADHRLAEQHTINRDQLNKENILLLGKGHCFREQVLATCPRVADKTMDDSDVAWQIEGSSLETIRHMVASGIGITVLPETASGVGLYSNALLVIRPFVPPVPYRTIVLAARKGFPRVDAIQRLQDALLTCGIKPS